MQISRRRCVLGLAAVTATPLLSAPRPEGPLVENTIHMFSDDQTRFPFHPNATYRPESATVEQYSAFAREARIDHAVIVHSEVYQDDHRYLQYCFEHEPRRGFSKGTCLFDPIDPKTPVRMEQLVKELDRRIVGIRIHQLRKPNTPPTVTGPMRDRDLRSEGMKNTWRKAHELGLILQVQTIPAHAPQIGELASNFSRMPVLIDHLAFPARGTAAEYESVLQLSRFPNVYIKVSTVREEDKALVKRLYESYGADRLIWGSFGKSMPACERALALSGYIFDYVTEQDRMKIRGRNAMKLFGFSA